MSTDKIIKSEENTYKKVSKTRKLVYISIGLIVVGIILFSLSLMGLNHSAINQPINEVFKFIGI